MKLLLIALMLLALMSAASAEEPPALKWGQTNAAIPYTLPGKLPVLEGMPDLLTFEDGSKVETAEDWAKRRAEIKGLYEYYMYGYMPDGSEETLTWTAENGVLTITVARGGKEARLTVPFVLPQGEAPEGAFTETQTGIAVKVDTADGQKCCRCWSYSTEGVVDEDGDFLCERCRKILN